MVAVPESPQWARRRLYRSSQWHRDLSQCTQHTWLHYRSYMTCSLQLSHESATSEITHNDDCNNLCCKLSSIPQKKTFGTHLNSAQQTVCVEDLVGCRQTPQPNFVKIKKTWLISRLAGSSDQQIQLKCGWKIRNSADILIKLMGLQCITQR